MMKILWMEQISKRSFEENGNIKDLKSERQLTNFADNQKRGLGEFYTLRIR